VGVYLNRREERLASNHDVVVGGGDSPFHEAIMGGIKICYKYSEQVAERS
jgi:hypothetical protein